MNICAQTPSLTLVDKIALLAGMRNRHVLPQSEMQGGDHLPLSRTCIDAGGDLLISLRPGVAPGIGRGGQQAGQGNARHWQRELFSENSPKGASLVFGRPTATDYDQAAAFTRYDFSKNDAIILLRGYGHIYMATDAEPETGESWLSFALHPRQTMRTVLSAIGEPRLWSEFSERLEELFQRKISENLRPWSIAVGLNSGAIRLGTSAWARMAENPKKAQALGRQIGEMGGDSEQAGAIYNLLSRHATIRANRPCRIGAAVEYQYINNHFEGAFYTLRASGA